MFGIDVSLLLQSAIALRESQLMKGLINVLNCRLISVMAMMANLAGLVG